MERHGVWTGVRIIPKGGHYETGAMEITRSGEALERPPELRANHGDLQMPAAISLL